MWIWGWTTWRLQLAPSARRGVAQATEGATVLHPGRPRTPPRGLEKATPAPGRPSVVEWD